MIEWSLSKFSKSNVMRNLKRRRGTSITAPEIDQVGEFNGQFTDVFNKNDQSEVPFLSRSAPFMDGIVVSKCNQTS